MFDYSPLDTKIAEQARSTADRIRERLKKTLEDLMEVGNDLLAVKERLCHTASSGCDCGPPSTAKSASSVCDQLVFQSVRHIRHRVPYIAEMKPAAMPG